MSLTPMALSRTIASLCLELVNSSRVARIRGDDAPTSSTMISGVARADPWDGTGLLNGSLGK